MKDSKNEMRKYIMKIHRLINNADMRLPYMNPEKSSIGAPDSNVKINSLDFMKNVKMI